MKKIAIIIALVAASLTAATAKTMQQANAADSYASAYRGKGIDAMANASNSDVYAYGEYVGSDPDLNIRSSLMRDPLLKDR